MFSIIIPTFNNLDYLKLCLLSLKNNSVFKNEIIIHVNDGSDGSLQYVKENYINYTHSLNNIGLCSAVNIDSKMHSALLNKLVLSKFSS